MKMLDISRRLYVEKGVEMIERLFPQYAGEIAVGLAGHGSQCYGYDDELSADHDYAPGFCLWLEDELDEQIGLELARAYRSIAPSGDTRHSAMGGNTLGVQRTGDFFLRYTGCRGAPEGELQWLYLPSHALAEAVNGQIWRDDKGVFSAIRHTVAHGMPEDVRIKKISAKLLIMAQSGQYNYARCIKRGQQGAAMLAMSEFVKCACSVIFLLNRRHMPYYKWCFRAMDELEELSSLRYPLEFLLTGENDDAGSRLKEQLVEDVCAAVVSELKAQRLTCGSWDYLEPHAFDMHEHITSARLRSLHVMEGAES